MYRNKIPQINKTSIRVNNSYQGERIEEKVHRIVNNKEPIKDGAPLVYTERKDGVQPAYDIRTDKFEIAVEAMDKVAEQHLTNRKKRFEKNLEDINKSENKEPGGEKTPSNQEKNTGENRKPSGDGKSGDLSL